MSRDEAHTPLDGPAGPPEIFTEGVPVIIGGKLRQLRVLTINLANFKFRFKPYFGDLLRLHAFRKVHAEFQRDQLLKYHTLKEFSVGTKYGFYENY